VTIFRQGLNQQHIVCRRGRSWPCVNDRTLAELSTVTDDQVEAAIKKLPNKSSPLDALLISLLKLCLPEIVSMIINIATPCLTAGVFLRSWSSGRLRRC